MTIIEALRLARGYLAEASGMLDESDRDDAPALAQSIDRAEQDVRAVETALEATRKVLA